MLILWILWLFASVARATPYDVTFCVEVDIGLVSGGVGGTNWDDDTDNKPARGFAYELLEKVGGVTSTFASGYLDDSGGDLGCVTPPTLNSNNEYKFKAISEASVDGNTIEAWDDSTSQQLAIETLITFNPSATTTIILTLDGEIEDRWNHLALAAFALYFENAGISGENFRILSNEGPCCSASGNNIYLDGSDNKFTVIHEVGHVVSNLVNGGLGLAKDYDADLNGCAGGGDAGGSTDHGTATKEYYSAAMVEGMADWYSALTWNDITTSATTCEYLRGHNIDFDISGGAADFIADINPYPCTGDPMPGVGWLDDEDWLDDAIAQGAGGCTTPLQNRSTQFDFVRYLFAMRTVENLTMNQIWTLWDDSNPHNWDVDGGGGSNDPEERWEAAADGISGAMGTSHDNQKDHGMDH